MIRHDANYLRSWPLLPPPAKVLFGREKELGLAVSSICDHVSTGACLIILGTGGVGKTSIALGVLHHERVADIYKIRRLFVSCEGAADAAGVLNALATALHLSGEALQMQVLHSLSEHPTLIVLDNFETPWEPPASRTGTEGLLGAISSLTGVAVLVTMRGAERPSGTRWIVPHLPVLLPFNRDAALQTVYFTAPTANNSNIQTLTKLLDALGDLPLAVHIIAAMMQHESLEELLSRWLVERTSMLTLGGEDKLSSLDLSIRTSLHSPRMRALPAAADLLLVVSLFVDGIVETDDGLRFLQPGLPRIRQHISVLKQSSLVFTSSSGRLCVLPPVREFVRRRQTLPEGLVLCLVRYFVDFVAPLERYQSDIPGVNALIVPELQNARVVLEFLLASGHDAVADVLSSIYKFDHYCILRGFKNQSILQHALLLAERVGRPDYLADVLMRLSGGFHDYPTEMSYAEKAIAYALQQSDKRRLAAAHLALASVLGRRHGNDVARNRRELLEALRVVEHEGDAPEIAHVRARCYESLARLIGDWNSDRDDKAQARLFILDAQRIYEQFSHKDGLNSCRMFLAHLDMQRCDFRSSEITARQVLEYARATKNTSHEAYALRVLTHTMTLRGDHLEAISCMQRHAQIFLQLGRASAWVWSIKNEAMLELEAGRLERADALCCSMFEEMERTDLMQTSSAMQCFKMRGALRRQQRNYVAASQDIDCSLKMARQLTGYSGSEMAACLVERAKLDLDLDQVELALCNLIVAILTFRKADDFPSTLECLQYVGQALAAFPLPLAAWSCWSASLRSSLQSGATFDAANSLLSMAELQATIPGESLPEEAQMLKPGARLRRAFELFEANSNEAGMRRSLDTATRLGLADPSEPVV